MTSVAEIDPRQIRDICLSCGAEHDYALWGASCSCGNSNTVHQLPCDECGATIGVITDDDYCGPSKLICPQCLNSKRTNRTTI